MNQTIVKAAREFEAELKGEGYVLLNNLQSYKPIAQVGNRNVMFYCFEKEGTFVIDLTKKQIHHFSDKEINKKNTQKLINRMAEFSKKILIANLF